MFQSLNLKKTIGLSVFFLLCCSAANTVELPSGVSKHFFWLPPEQRAVEFEKYDFESQYMIYIYGQQRIEPPALELAWTFAREGKEIVKPLEVKLAVARDDLTIRDIVYVFELMHSLGSYNVVANESLMDQLREKVSAMKDPSWQDIAQDSLLSITNNQFGELQRSGK